MTNQDDVFRRLQRHLDAQAVGFPATPGGEDVRLLKTLFTSEEASLALHLDYSPKSTAHVVSSQEDSSMTRGVPELLDAMFMKGVIARREKDGEVFWQLIPLVVGMFEAAGNEASPRKLGAMLSYMRTEEWNRALSGTRPSQMRTIPIGASIKVERTVARYDDAREIFRTSEGPFAVLSCICRELAAKSGHACSGATLKESCLGIGEAAASMLRQGRGREISLGEALGILAQNKADGLVLQPANAKEPEFICSCCGCCCGMLGYLKTLDHPLEHWTTSYQASVDPALCSACGLCETRCQIAAIALDSGSGTWRVDENRCIGCGLCASKCPSEAIRLSKREPLRTPPENADELYRTIKANRTEGCA